MFITGNRNMWWWWCNKKDFFSLLYKADPGKLEAYMYLDVSCCVSDATCERSRLLSDPFMNEASPASWQQHWNIRDTWFQTDPSSQTGPDPNHVPCVIQLACLCVCARECVCGRDNLQFRQNKDLQKPKQGSHKATGMTRCKEKENWNPWKYLTEAFLGRLKWFAWKAGLAGMFSHEHLSHVMSGKRIQRHDVFILEAFPGSCRCLTQPRLDGWKKKKRLSFQMDADQIHAEQMKPKLCSYRRDEAD